MSSGEVTAKMTNLNLRFGTVVAILALLPAGCSAPPQAAKARPDPTTEAAYAEVVAQLTALDRQAEDLLQHSRHDEAAAAITKGQPLQARLLAPSQPTLTAMEAVSDLDDLYARMLVWNHREAWATTLYQKNVVRWKGWKPQTADTLRRLHQAQAGLAECSRRMKQ
jgi:hypothetical protein